MSKHTLERKLAAPVCCLHCKWIGKVAELKSQGSEMAGVWHCPSCGSTATKFIENEAPAGVQ